MVTLDDREYDRRPPGYPIPIYAGEVLETNRKIAIIETRGYEFDNDDTRERMFAELKHKARRLGGDAVEDARVLSKRIRGYTVDERTPFLSWKQGRYELYFMRGEVVTYESGLPGAVSSGEGFVDDVRGYVPPGSEERYTDVDEALSEGRFVPTHDMGIDPLPEEPPPLETMPGESIEDEGVPGAGQPLRIGSPKVLGH